MRDLALEKTIAIHRECHAPLSVGLGFTPHNNLAYGKCHRLFCWLGCQVNQHPELASRFQYTVQTEIKSSSAEVAKSRALLKSVFQIAHDSRIRTRDSRFASPLRAGDLSRYHTVEYIITAPRNASSRNAFAIGIDAYFQREFDGWFVLIKKH